MTKSNVDTSKLILKIKTLSRDSGLGLIDTIVALVEEDGVDMDDIISILDDNFSEQLRVDAINNRHVVGIKKETPLF